MDVPTLRTYYTRANGANTALVSIGDLDLYYSYTTLVAFRHPKVGLVVHENVWSQTTAQHLCCIDGGGRDAAKRRVDDNEFQRLWHLATSPPTDIRKAQ